jgi:hypothetical protein
VIDRDKIAGAEMPAPAPSINDSIVTEYLAAIRSAQVIDTRIDTIQRTGFLV